MACRIGLVSDVHAAPAPLREALEKLRDAGAELILCAGDIAGYGPDLAGTVELLDAGDCRSILGNHDLWYLARCSDEVSGSAADFLRQLPEALELNLADVRLVMVHGSPPASLMNGIRMLDEEGRILPGQQEFWRERLRDCPGEVLVVGHTHQVFAEQLGEMLVINPGSTCFNHSCALLTLPDKTVEFIALGGEELLPAWNWGMERGGAG